MTEQTHIQIDEVIRELVLATEIDDEGTLLGQAQVGGYPGIDLASALPYVSIETVSGGADYFEQDPVVDIDVFASTRASAKNIAAALQLAFLRYPHSVLVAGREITIDSANCISLPVKLPWEDENIRRQSATYQFSVRR